MRAVSIKKGLVFLFVFWLGLPVLAERVKDMATIAGQRGNQLIGYGLVVGLDGTGESNALNPITDKASATCWHPLG